MVSYDKHLAKSAKKFIKEQFKIEREGFTFCPYLVCSGDKDPHNYFSKDFWLAICKEFIQTYENS